MLRTANPSTPVRFRPQPPRNKMTKINKAIIPVAGLGTRMLPATKAIPKELLPIIDKPLIQYVVEEAIEGGIKEIILVTRSGKEAIENHFDINYELEHRLESTGKKASLKTLKKIIPFDIKISSVRQENALGLGHAICTAKHLLNGEDFAILLPDEILLSKTSKTDFQTMMNSYAKTNKGQILVEKVKMNEVKNYGIININKKLLKKGNSGSIDGLIEKPSIKKAPSCYRIVGRYILPYEILSYIENSLPDKSGEIQLTAALNNFINNKEKILQAFLSNSYIFDCGSRKGFLGANIALASRDKKLKKYLKEVINN